MKLYITEKLRDLLVLNKNSIGAQLQQLREENNSSRERGNLGSEGREVQVRFIIDCLVKFDRKITHNLTSSIEHEKINVGARIMGVIDQEFKAKVEQYKYKISQDAIYTTIKNCSGINEHFFVSQKAFEVLVIKIINSFKQICLDTVAQIVQILQELLGEIEFDEIKIYSCLKKSIVQNHLDLLNRDLEQI